MAAMIILQSHSVPRNCICGLMLYCAGHSKKSINSNDKPGIYHIGKYVFDYTMMALEINGHAEKLSAKECELIYMLASNINTLVNREIILKKVWGNDDYFSAKNMDVYVSKIRKRLKDDPAIEILNAYGIGFKMIVNTQA